MPSFAAISPFFPSSWNTPRIVDVPFAPTWRRLTLVGMIDGLGIGIVMVTNVGLPTKNHAGVAVGNVSTAGACWGGATVGIVSGIVDGTVGFCWPFSHIVTAKRITAPAAIIQQIFI
jgi:hypothetical protein